MAISGDTARPRSVKARICDNFSATAHGGAVLIEKVVRRIGLHRSLAAQLPKRSGDYTSVQIASQVIEGLLVGGKGFHSTALLRSQPLLAQIFGHNNVAEEATVGRAMCDLAGLAPRKFEDTYKKVSSGPSSIDMLGRDKPQRSHMRIVPDEPEAMTPACREKMTSALQAVAVSCAQKLHVADLSLMGFVPVHGDGTILEVKGSCFDAANKDRNGNQSLSLMTLALGPVFVNMRLMPGASDEGKAMPDLIKDGASTINTLGGKRPVLALLDAAFAENEVVAQLNREGWYYVICANQQRQILERLAQQIQDTEWITAGADPQRGWSENQVAVMRHQPQGWEAPQTVIVRRWRKSGELQLAWHYSFLYTNLTSDLLPKKQLKRHGWPSIVWMLYDTKQGRENTYKTWLSDLGGHHPASGRLGASESLAYLQAMAANVQAVISYKVVPVTDRGIRAWRFVRDYVTLAGKVVMQAGSTLMVTLAGADMPESVRRLWYEAYCRAEKL